MNQNFGIKSNSSMQNQRERIEIAQKLRKSPILDIELIGNLGIYLERMHLSRILLMHSLYQRIINVPGIIIEFGVRWGQNIVLFNSFRGMYEPYNYSRKIVGFDTFSGFPDISKQDNGTIQEGTKKGHYSVTDNWKIELESILSHHDSLSPLSHIQKWELIEGDASLTFPKFLENHPEIIVSLAYFDFDLYMPTKNCLELLIKKLPKGAIVVFDELNCPEFPGETIAFQEIIGINNVKLEREPNNPLVSWFVVE